MTETLEQLLRNELMPQSGEDPAGGKKGVRAGLKALLPQGRKEKKEDGNERKGE